MKTVFIVPTGIGAEIGGHAGDATPAFKLIASLSDIAITHPNVVNASDINEMPENTWYVEGSMLDEFLWGQRRLKKPLSNKILLVVNSPVRPETVNAVNAARHTIGCAIEIVELDEPFEMVGGFNADGSVGGEHSPVDALVSQVSGHTFDALAMATEISVPKDVALNYMRSGGVNPWGGIEAIVSKAIAEEVGAPFAHAPIENQDEDIMYFNEVVPSRIAAEAISMCYLHCVLKGLHKAPRIARDDDGIGSESIDCLITPLNCFGEPHKACIAKDIPIIAVKNKTCLSVETPYTYLAESYIEAAGYVSAIKAGVSPEVIK